MNLVKFIDHTLLRADTTKEEIDKLIQEAKKYNFASVCINPIWVHYAACKLKETDVKVCTVIGFPLGASTLKTKVFEAKDAIEDGATEIDMVINIGAMKAGNYDYVEEEIVTLVNAVQEKAILKVIIETCLLTKDEKISACQLAVKAGANFVKTSTGFSKNGATIDDVMLMRKSVGANCGVKASGGIRSLCDMEAMIEAGADRIGTSYSVKIMEEQKVR